MDTRLRGHDVKSLSFPTSVIGNPSPSPSFPCKRESRFVFRSDGSPLTTCGDDDLCVFGFDHVSTDKAGLPSGPLND